MLEHCAERGQRDGRAIEIALRVIASCGRQKGRLRFGFNALGDDLDAEFMRKANGRPDHCCIPRIVGDAKHQILRDLQPVNRINGQVFKRRKAGSEIVDRNAQADLPKTLQRVAKPL